MRSSRKTSVTFPMKLILSVLYLHETVIGYLECQIPFGNENGTLKPAFERFCSLIANDYETLFLCSI